MNLICCDILYIFNKKKCKMKLNNFLNEIEMFLTGTLGIMLRYAYMKRKEEVISKVRLWSYFFISFAILILLIIYLSDKETLFNYKLDDSSKMIISAIGSLFSDRFFIFLMDNDEVIIKKLLKKYFKQE